MADPDGEVTPRPELEHQCPKALFNITEAGADRFFLAGLRLKIRNFQQTTNKSVARNQAAEEKRRHDWCVEKTISPPNIQENSKKR